MGGGAPCSPDRGGRPRVVVRVIPGNKKLTGAIPGPDVWSAPCTYEAENRAAAPGGRIEEAMRGIRPRTGAHVLDTGCGTGFHLPRFAVEARWVTGVEPQRLAEAARARVRTLPDATVHTGVAQRLINLILSDKVLKAALDAKPIQAGAVYELAQKVFQRAGLNRVRLYTTEANEYNGLAIGMTIGRSMVVLTSATLKLPPDAIEGILAHEAVHVKKRDVLTGQLLRILGIVVLVGLVYINVDTLQALADKKWLLVPVFMVIPWLYAVYLSFTQQWMEVRADHAGSAFLEGGKEQMAQALRLLTLQQEQALAKNLRYSLTDQEREKREKKMTSQLERDTWGWRFLEFQLQAHPPMYWRIKTLETVDQPWGWNLFKRWWVDRWRESLPD